MSLLKYEKVYKGQRHALGEPAKEFISFFESLQIPIKVLDLGCGQGRDALFIARLGHRVTGIDLSPTGIEQLVEDAEKEELQIKAEVADLTAYTPDAAYDIVLLDRTLHMLQAEDRLQLLQRTAPHVRSNGFVLICDERKNLPAFKTLFMQEMSGWQVVREIKGFLFLQRVD